MAKSFGLLRLLVLVLALINVWSVQFSEAKVVAFKDSVKQFNKWTCNQPKPRVIHIADLDDGQFIPNLIYTPSALVIHRCDKSTGCCLKPGAVCKSVESEEENVQFSVRMKAIHGKKKDKRGLINLTNHTRCQCVDPIDSRAKRSITLF